MELGGLGVLWDPGGGFNGQTTLRKFLGHKEHLDWLKIDFNVAKNITVQGYTVQFFFITKKNWCEWNYTYTVFKLRVISVKIYWQHKKAKAARHTARDLKNLCILSKKIGQSDSGPGGSAAGVA